MVVKFPPGVQHHRFTVEGYHRMAELGILTEDHPVELIDGEVFRKADRRSPHLLGTATQERYRFTPDEYQRLLDAGILTDHDRIELSDGEVVTTMTIGDPHAACVDRLNHHLHG